jgi:uncharacterized membrane protein
MDRNGSWTLDAERLAVGLGYFSIGLGLAELLAPGSIARLIGIPASETTRRTVRASGAREIANGAGILSAPDKSAWLWSRLGGDALDLALLGAAAGRRVDAGRVTAAAAAVAGVTALDVYCAQRLRRTTARRASEGAIHVVQTATINRPVEQVFAFWRNFENFPRFMRHLESVQILGSGRSRWRAKAPDGRSVAWDAEILQDRENEVIAWRSLEGSQVQNRGAVSLAPAPGARGTEIRVELHYRPPAGALGRSLEWLFSEEPSQQIHEDLNRFKQLLETGEIPLSDGLGLWRAAQPATSPALIRTLAGVHR